MKPESRAYWIGILLGFLLGIQVSFAVVTYLEHR